MTEIMTEKTELDTYETTIASLQTELDTAKDPSTLAAEEKKSTQEFDEILRRLDEEYTTMTLQFQREFTQRKQEKKDRDDYMERQLKELQDEQNHEIEAQMQADSEKMMSSHQAYQLLAEQKVKEEMAFQQSQIEVYDKHSD